LRCRLPLWGGPRLKAGERGDRGQRGERPDRISLEHGSGGALSRWLTEQVIYPFFRGEHYAELADAGPFRLDGGGLLTTDTYVVDPPFFPGGDIGRLAVFGTCNDLAVCGAMPLALSLGLVLEEGFLLEDLRRVLASVRAAADEAGVRVVTGDTKVVPAGKGGGIYLNTAGVGRATPGLSLSPARMREGDRVLVSAPVGAHGLAVLAARESLPVGPGLVSDCANLHPLCAGLGALGPDLRCMRDATRGGVAAILNELAGARGLGLALVEQDFPVDGTVAAAAGLLGLNPLEIANEGVLVAVVAGDAAERALGILRAHPLGAEARDVGGVTAANPGRVLLETSIGGRRWLDMPRGLLLPRIC
jgi:hydrogenase expression/formation protein HypE